jgi:hypothetical protein
MCGDVVAKKGKTAFSGLASGGAKVVIEPADLVAFLQENKDIRDLLISQAKIVQGEASSTAQDAQGGPAGKLTGYAEAGFDVEWQQRSKRPQVIVRSNADSETATRVHFSTQKRWGIAHMRKALKAIT